MLQSVLICDSGSIWHFLIASMAAGMSIIEKWPWNGELKT